MLHLESIRPMKAQTSPLAGGDAGIAQTIHAMNRLIDQGKKDPRIHELGAKILREARVPPAFNPHADFLAIRAVSHWIPRNIRYTRDVIGKETLHSAAEIVDLGIGDCDDFTILICSILETIGIRCRIVTISSHSLDPSQFTHVFPEAKAGARWIPVDFARKNAGFAKGPEHWARRREWSTTSDEFEDVAGLAGYGARIGNMARPIEGYGGRPAITARPMAGGDLNVVTAYDPAVTRKFRLGYNPNALPNAYTTRALPRFRRSKAIAPMGVGHYGSRALGNLAQDSGFDWSTLVPAITAGTTGAANIIAAERAAPQNLYPTTAAIGQPAGLSPYASPYGVSPYGVSPTIAGIPTGTLLLFGFALAAIYAFRR